jgi:hypothetical protein
MKTTRLVELSIYALVILLGVIIFALVLISPATLLDVSAVYKGF